MTLKIELPYDEIAAICQRYGVRRLAVFGSATTERFDPRRSDVDFLVEFHADARASFRTYFALRNELSALLHTPVDLVMRKALRNPHFAASVGRTEQEVYAA